MLAQRRGPELASWLYLALLLCLIAIFACMPVYPYGDFWGHAAAGRWAVENSQVPRRGLFVWTAPDQPWADHIWLSQVGFYGLTRLGVDDEASARAAVVLVVVLAGLPFVLAWLVWRRRAAPGVLTLLLFYLAVTVSRSRFVPRPELFTTVGVALLLWLLTDWRRDFSRRRAWLTGAALILLFALWANLHGGFVIGLLLLSATVACDWFQSREWRSRLLALFALLALLASFLNPYGPSVYRALLLVQSRTFETIQEWKPLWRIWPIPWIELARYAVLLTVALLAWSLNPARRLAHLAWLFLGTGLFAFAIRNGPLLALICLLVTADNAVSLDAGTVWRAAVGPAVRRQATPAAGPAGRAAGGRRGGLDRPATVPALDRRGGTGTPARAPGSGQRRRPLHEGTGDP